MFTIDEIIKATKGKLISGNPKSNISGISTDSRTVKPGELFIALKGKNFDGRSFIEAAVNKGASAVLLEPNTQYSTLNTNIIKVKDTLKAFGKIAHHHRMKFNIPFIGITGSNGKTTTKEMVSSVLGRRFAVLKNEGTENNLIGVSRTLLRLDAAHTICALELGTNHFGEIRALAEILAPGIGIITNCGPSHLEFLRSKAGVLKEKLGLFDVLKKGSPVLLNADDPLLSGIASKRRGPRIIKFGIENECDFRATKIFAERDDTIFIVNNRYEFRIRLLGRHNIYNCLAAIATGFLYNVSYDDIRSALERFEAPRGRSVLKKTQEIALIDDTYNSNPASLDAALEILSAYSSRGHKILVCGDMLELGAQSEAFHKDAARRIANSGIDRLIAVGKFSDIVCSEAVNAGMAADAAIPCQDNRQVIKMLKEIVMEGDVVLLKGSRLMKLDEVADALLSFIPIKRPLVRV
ncbi:MAG: UDP-N-acetylmuramoyl-tripeptide--D-alanyl-D-alanine ligase [Candidatus Omnitrophica bacterium]|nr:UDP-N-acetylmuramoyl-tripeptide--D-alanyl-D-alanine ligase [Candidatus Omnitrophota bacterium]